MPQGSHICPFIFVLFVNDLCTTIHSSKYMLADDLNFFRTINSTVHCCVIQEHINSLIDWCTLNGMEITVQKCNVISFSISTRVTTFDYKISTASINRKATVTDLGIILDYKLNFVQHVASTTTIYCLKSLFCALVRSIFEYGVIVRAPYHAVQINRVKQKKSPMFTMFKKSPM